MLDLIVIFKYNIDYLSMMYMVLPLVFFKVLVMWNAITLKDVEEIGRSLEIVFYLNVPGLLRSRLKSTLPSLPMYFLSRFPTHIHVANTFEKLLSDFL